MSLPRTINFTLNGIPVAASVEPHHNLIELLQVQFGLTGAREACGQGLCGCCTVLVDGAEVATIEGFDACNQLSPEQEAFIETGAFQCGYCTSGFIIMATQLLDEHPEPTDNQIQHYLSGNLCRCAAYPEIIAAVKLAASKRKARATSGATTART
jgi:carbon-monoxide dehydrogenase small subunit